MNGIRTIIEKREISNSLTLKISLSPEEDYVYLNIDYKKGKFTIEKMFRNNTFDLEKMDEEISKLNSEEKVRLYLNLDGNN